MGVFPHYPLDVFYRHRREHPVFKPDRVFAHLVEGRAGGWRFEAPENILPRGGVGFLGKLGRTLHHVLRVKQQDELRYQLHIPCVICEVRKRAYRKRGAEVPAAPAWRPRVPLTRPLQQAVLAYAERAPRLSPERAEELAEIAPQLTAGAQGRNAVERLYGLARVLTGQAR
jgi:hypothetical protein